MASFVYRRPVEYRDTCSTQSYIARVYVKHCQHLPRYYNTIPRLYDRKKDKK